MHLSNTSPSLASPTSKAVIMGDDSVRDYGIAAPHGPNRTGHHVATEDILLKMNKGETDVFRSLLLPDDSYDETGTYWADMPIWRRIQFVNKVDSQEAKKELKAIGSMIKKDPLSPLSYYMRNMVIPGAGLLLEGFVLTHFPKASPILTIVQLCPVLNWQCQASSRLCIPQLLGLTYRLQRNMAPVHRIPRNYRHHRWSDPRRSRW